MTSLVPILLTAALGASDPSARLEPHDGALRYCQTVLPSRGGLGYDLTLASSSDLRLTGSFGTGIGIAEDMTITVLPGGVLHFVDPGPCPSCSAVVAEPSPELLATSVAAAAATLRASGVSDLAAEAEAYALRLQDDGAFRGAEWRRQSDAWLGAARAETATGIARLPVGAHYRAVALPGGFLRYATPAEIQEFDASGRLRRVVSRGGIVREIERDASGRIRRIADGSGEWVSFEHDAEGRVVLATSSNGNSARFGYDASGRLAWSEAEDGRLKYGWNDAGQLASVTGDGVEIRASYLPPSQGGKLESLSTAEDSTERYTYERHADGLVQVTEVHDVERDGLHPIPARPMPPWMRSDAPPARRYTFVEPLGADGRRFVWQQTVEDDGETRVTTYDQRTHRRLSVSTDMGTVEYRHDDLGRVIERRTEERVTQYEYAPVGRVSRVVGRDVTEGAEREATFQIDFLYDERGDLLEASDFRGTELKLKYDDRHRVVEVTTRAEDEEHSRHVLLTYGDRGRPVRLEAVGMGWIDVTYKEDGKIDEVKSSGPGVAWEVTAGMNTMLSFVRSARVEGDP
jgi:YD repeat-containing protein